MKTNPLLRGLIGLLLLVCSLAATGCQSGLTFQQKLAEIDQLGVTEFEITGKFSHTKYSLVEKDGKLISTLDHNNVWVPLVHITRERPALGQANPPAADPAK